MCGIGGLVGGVAPEVPELERMAGAMIHRGPDGHGVWRDEQAGVAFRRRAIIDLHERSNQPLHLDQLHPVFNGEIYNYLELREELRRLGHRFVTEGDGVLLLHARVEWGEEALDRLNEMFAFAVWDAGKRRITLVTDRLAEKPLFFAASPGRLTFASDVRAMRAADPSIGVPDAEGTARFLALGTMPALPRTFYIDVRLLPPAHVAHWRASDGVSMRRWWEPATIDVPREPAAAARSLRELLAASVTLRLRSDVPVGTSLGGGVDSSAIVAIASEVSKHDRRHAFTASFPGFARDEWPHAEAAAAAAAVIEHHLVRPKIGELLDDLPALVASQEEPFPSTSIYAQWRVMRAVREAGVPVLLDGQGADELFAGYPAVAGWALRSLGARAVLGALARDRHRVEPVGVACLGGRALGPLALRYRLRVASPYIEPALARDAAGHADAQLPWAAGSPLRQELLTEAFSSSLPHLCRFADRDSKASSVEVRLPLLDPRVADFAYSLAPDLLWRDGVTKPVLRESVRGLVPDVVLERRDKVGFETPEHQWFGSELGRARVAEILLARGRWLKAEVERDLKVGAWRDTAAIWRAVNVELWQVAVREPSVAISR